jgi:hypothetical protein
LSEQQWRFCQPFRAVVNCGPSEVPPTADVRLDPPAVEAAGTLPGVNTNALTLAPGQATVQCRAVNTSVEVRSRNRR